MEASLENLYRDHRMKAEVKRQSLEQELITVGGENILLTNQRRQVLMLKPTDLLVQLRQGKLSAGTVVESYQAKALEVTKRTNCITEFIPDARAWAEALDKLAPDERRALHGLPVSVKDNVMVKGLDCTLGLLKKVGQPAPVDADVVAVLKELGAVPFVKTNVSQICLTPGCSNPLWGKTIHPLDPTRSPGGSSGGEGALISEGGSVFGLGTDMGGSVRVPSNWCGLTGFKPTSKRISNVGVANVPGPVGAYGTVGMIGRDGAFVAEAVKAIFSSNFNALDPEVPPLPWNDSVYLSKKALRVGWFDSTALFPSTPGVKRAVAQAVAAFKVLGHEVVQFTIPKAAEMLKIYLNLLMADHGELAKSLLDGEILDDELNWFMEISAGMPHDERNNAKLRREFGDLAVEYDLVELATISDLWAKIGERRTIFDNFLKAWRAAGLDILLCPVTPAPATKAEHVGKISSCLLTTMLFNLLDCPAVAVPVTHQTMDDEKNIQDYPVTDYIHGIFKQDATNAVGLPLGVQLVALPYCEELLCRALAELSNFLNYKC